MARKTADDIANDLLSNIDLTHAVCEQTARNQAETIAELKQQNEALFTIIQRMVNGATGSMGVNSLDREYAHITQNVLDIGRDALKDTGRKYNHRPTRPFMSSAEAKARG
jgi:L,D-peptidoglycan transpeptidase YkuD (ErfK/YbiS/YcfS/YnhG family)